MSMSGSVTNWQIRESKKKKRKKKKRRRKKECRLHIFYNFLYAFSTFDIDTFHGIMHSKYSQEHEHDASVVA